MKMFVAGAVVAAATNIDISPLTLFIDVATAVGVVGGIGVGLVALYRARSDKGLTNVQSMEILFEKQREVNLEMLELRDAQIERLEAQLAEANGNREELEEQLRGCRRERAVLRNQVKGLEKTLKALHDEHG